MVQDFEVTHELGDLPPAAWSYLKAKGFFAMIIPKKYGGLEFSAYGHTQVMTKLSTRCSALSISGALYVSPAASPHSSTCPMHSRATAASVRRSRQGGIACIGTKEVAARAAWGWKCADSMGQLAGALM